MWVSTCKVGPGTPALTSSVMMPSTRSSFSRIGMLNGSCSSALVTSASRTCAVRQEAMLEPAAAGAGRPLEDMRTTMLLVWVRMGASRRAFVGFVRLTTLCESRSMHVSIGKNSTGNQAFGTGATVTTASKPDRGALQQHVPLHDVAAQLAVLRRPPWQAVQRDGAMETPAGGICRQHIELCIIMHTSRLTGMALPVWFNDARA